MTRGPRGRCALLAVAAAGLFGFGVATFAAERDARAGDDTIKRPGDHPDYSVEIEPHGDFGWTGVYASDGFGLGARFGIPIVKNGFIPSINNSVAISFGLDFLHYSGCYFLDSYGCGANYLFLPATLQWNFFVAQHWSVFGEPGLYIYHGFFDTGYCDRGNFRGLCAEPTATGVGPAFFVGGRYHFNEHIALTMRIGYPTISVGVSFM